MTPSEKEATHDPPQYAEAHEGREAMGTLVFHRARAES